MELGTVLEDVSGESMGKVSNLIEGVDYPIQRFIELNLLHLRLHCKDFEL